MAVLGLEFFFSSVCAIFLTDKVAEKKLFTSYSTHKHFPAHISMFPSLPATPKMSCLLSFSFLDDNSGMTNLHRSWATSRVLILTRASLLQSTSTAVWNLIRHIKLILNHRMTEAILPWMIKSPEHFCPL